MKAVTSKEIKQELSNRSSKDLMDICLRLARFKKENKELLTYLLFETNEESYVDSVKEEIDEQFKQVNKKTSYYIRKSLRKILTNTKKYIRYSSQKETEIELLIYFCKKVKAFRPSIWRNLRIANMYHTQVEHIQKKVKGLHEDLQFDYEDEIVELEK